MLRFFDLWALHSNEITLPFVIAMTSGQGKGFTPDPATLATDSPLSHRICINSLSALDPLILAYREPIGIAVKSKGIKTLEAVYSNERQRIGNQLIRKKPGRGLRITDDHTHLQLRVQPNSSKFQFEYDQQTKVLRIRIESPPSEDKANKEIEKRLSKSFQARVVIVKGFKSKNKIIRVEKPLEEVLRLLKAKESSF